MQPVEADFFDFDPAVADRRLFALFESLATARWVEAGEAAVRAIQAEQR